jgi:hypothetical protein
MTTPRRARRRPASTDESAAVDEVLVAVVAVVAGVDAAAGSRT